MNLRIIVPEPLRRNRHGRYGCPTRACGRLFWLLSSYETHWIHTHRLKALPKVHPGPGPRSRAPISGHDLGDIIAQRVRTVPDWSLGPHCPHPEPHYQHDALCVIAEDGYHLTRKDT